MLDRCPWYRIVRVVFCLLRVVDHVGVSTSRGFSLIPGGSSPEASSNDVACRSFCWMSFKCCLGEMSFSVDSSPLYVGVLVFSSRS